MADLNYQLSYWERESFLKNIDIVVIGSGIVGLSAAIFLKKTHPDWHVVVIERGAMPIGASTRNAGFACFGSLTELIDDLEKMGEDAVFSIVEKRWRGLQMLRSVVGDENLDFKMHGGYEMFTDSDFEIFEKCAAAIPFFNEKIGQITDHPKVYSQVDERIKTFGFRGVSHLILNQPEGQVHTGKMMARLIQIALNQGVKIFNGIEIKHFEDSKNDGVRLETSMGWQLKSRKMLIAVNGFAQQFLPGADVFPARNQVLITQPIPGLAVEGCFHYDRGYYYFRNIDGRILLGGGRNLDFEGEKTVQFGTTELIRSALIQLLKTVILPGKPVEVDSWWSGILGLGSVKKPIVKKVSENIAVSVRLSGMGVAIGTLVGQEGAGLLEN